MPISTATQTIEVTEAAAVSLSDIEQDPVNGGYARDVRVFAIVSGGTAQTEIFRLRMRSETREGIEFTTPSLVL